MGGGTISLLFIELLIINSLVSGLWEMISEEKEARAQVFREAEGLPIVPGGVGKPCVSLQQTLEDTA